MKTKKLHYIPVVWKFWFCHAFAFLWFLFSVCISLPWIKDLGNIFGIVPSILIIAAIAYCPGYLNAFMVISLFVDKQPQFKVLNPTVPPSIFISCKNEEKGISDTIWYGILPNKIIKVK